MRSSPFVDFTSAYHSRGHRSVTDSDGKAEKGKLNKLRTERAGKQEKVDSFTGGGTALQDKPIYIHFFIGDCDWFISEYDGEDLFFGYAIIGNPIFAEWGYISFTELKQIRIPPGIEVDCEIFDPPLKASEIEEITAT